MSLDKGIKYGKERRKPYKGSKAIAVSCRNHGTCSYCLKNRKHKFRDRHPQTMEEAIKSMAELNNERNQKDDC